VTPASDVGVGIQHWCYHPVMVLVLHPALVLASGVGVSIWRWRWRLALALSLSLAALLSLVLPAGVGDVVAVPRRCCGCWWWAVGGCDVAPLPRRCHCQRRLVALCRSGSSMGWWLDDYIVRRKNL
jgi:hypothetical protein